MLQSAPLFCGTRGECLNNVQHHHYEKTHDADDGKHRKGMERMAAAIITRWIGESAVIPPSFSCDFDTPSSVLAKCMVSPLFSVFHMK